MSPPPEAKPMNKEQIYDAEISPLMTQIIAICKDNGIAMVASFAVPNDEDPDLRCTTHLLDGEGNPVADFNRAAHGLKNGFTSSFAAYTITKA